jgi:xylitol oxidase
MTLMTNWAGNYVYQASDVAFPQTMDELRQIVVSSPRLRVLGSRHSFNDIADTDGLLVSLARMPRVVEIDRHARTVRVDGGIRYGDVCPAIDAAGLALHNMASLPHISIAGAVATGTHGSGVTSGSLATAVSAITLLAADGSTVTLDRGHAHFDGAVVALGSLGVVVDLTLDLEQSFDVRQDVYEDLPVDAFISHFAEIAASAQSVSFFTDWRPDVVEQVWLKSRLPLGRGVPSGLFGARPATRNRHPISSMPAEACTPQLGVPGPWHARLPHFRMDHTPSSGDELQSEYFVAFNDAVAAFEALWPLRERIADLIQVTEIRTIAADGLWLSPCYERASTAFHFTWKPDWPRVRDLLPEIEAALAPFRPRANWGKLFATLPATVRDSYPQFADFVHLVSRYDPYGKFRNAYMTRLIEA